MLLDFANAALKTKIMSSSLCADGYGVENLINSKDYTRITFDSKFFMAEYFVKCPVKVLLEFPFLIDISYICLLYTSPSPRDKRQSRMPSSA